MITIEAKPWSKQVASQRGRKTNRLGATLAGVASTRTNYRDHFIDPMIVP